MLAGMKHDSMCSHVPGPTPDFPQARCWQVTLTSAPTVCQSWNATPVTTCPKLGCMSRAIAQAPPGEQMPTEDTSMVTTV